MPEKSKKRASRRAEKARMQAKARRISRSWGFRDDHLRKQADHLALCSCLSCGNRRRYEGDSLAEIRAAHEQDHQMLCLHDDLVDNPD